MIGEAAIHSYLTAAELVLAVVTFVALMRLTAPYGRHDRAGWGPRIPTRVGWIVMELSPVVVFAAIFFDGRHAGALVPLVFLGVWQWHYLHRAFIYPFRMKTRGTMPFVIVLLGITFNVLNAYINARWIGHLGSYDTAWLMDPRFGIGLALFAIGFVLNVHSDQVLFSLRTAGDTSYKIPMRGAWRFVSSPNYLGELIEWIGWAVMTWSLPGLAFAIYTAANLIPRAVSNHRWYHDTFTNYPKDRRILVPFLF